MEAKDKVNIAHASLGQYNGLDPLIHWFLVSFYFVRNTSLFSVTIAKAFRQCAPHYYEP